MVCYKINRKSNVNKEYGKIKLLFIENFIKINNRKI